MRTGFIFSEIFWGLLLVVIGLAAILRSFDINIPIFRVIVAFLLIYLGFSLLLGGAPGGISEPGTLIFREANLTERDFQEREINLIFSSGEIDLSQLDPEDIKTREINVIFGSSTVILSPDQLAEMDVSAVFSSVRLPDDNSIVFGDYNYRSPGLEEGLPADISLEISVVFGGMEIMLR